MSDLAELIISVKSTSAKDATKDLDSLTSSGDKAEKAIAKMIATAGGMYAIGRTLQSAAESAMAFEHAMATVGTVIDDRSKIPALTAQIRALSAEMGQMPADSARAMYDIVSAGATDAAKAMDILATADRLAVGGATQVGIAADGLTSIMAVYASSVSSATEVADKMFVSAAVGKTTIAELSGQIGMVAPIANTAGVSIGELLASIGALTKGGLNTATATTGIRSFLSQVVKHSNEASIAAKQVGFDYSVSALKAKGLLGFVEDLKAKTGGNVEVLGKIVGDIEGLNAALSLTGPMSKDFRDAVDAMAASSGKTGEAFAVMTDTAQFKMSQLSAKISNEAINVGNSLIGMVPLGGIVANFGALATAAAGLAKALALVMAMRGASWAAEWVMNIKTKIDIMIAARGHTIAMAQGDVAAAAAAVANANATITKSRAMSVSSGNTFAAAAMDRMLAAQELALAGATDVHTAALARLKAEQSIVSLGATGMKSVIAALGGPVGIVTGLVMLGAWAWSSYAEKAAKAREELQKVALANAQTATSAMGVSAAIRAGAAELAKATPGSKAADEATRKIAAAEQEIMGLGPQYRQMMQDKTKSASDLADQLERVARADASGAQAQIDQLENRKRRVVGLNDAMAKAGSWGGVTADVVDDDGKVKSRKALKDEYDRIEQALNPLYQKRGEYLKLVDAVAGDSPAAAAANKVVATSAKSVEAYQTEIDAIARRRVALEEGELALIRYDLVAKGFHGAQLQELVLKGLLISADEKRKESMTKETEAMEKYRDEVYKLAAAGPGKIKGSASDMDGQQYADQLNKRDDYQTRLDRLNNANKFGLKPDVYAKELHKLQLESNTVWGAMSYSIENFADRGSAAMASFLNGTKTGFRDMVSSAILDLERLILKEQVVAPFLKGMTGMNWGSLFGGSSGYSPSSLGNMGGFGTDLGTSWGGAFAGGGVTAPGKHYLVGENGPELFVPGQTGTVVPNGGGATTINSTVTVNVSSGGNVDAKASGNMGAQAASMLEGVVHQTIQKMMRPGGVLNQVGARS